jgi:transcriptional regulator with XRE-family HTH domain
MAQLADILVEGRRRRGWSQAELALRAGVSVSTVSRTEQGGGLPNVNSLKRLAAAIGYDPDAMARLAREPDRTAEEAWLPEVNAAGRAALGAIPGLTTADRLNERTILSEPQLTGATPRTVRVPHFGRVSAVRTDWRDEIGGEFSHVPDVGVDFTISVDGQCMEPRYEDSERVGCSIRRWESEGFVWGKDYWIRFKNGETTLKRVKPDPKHKEKFLCVPLNPKAKRFSRFKADVEKAARVLVVLSD